MWARECAAACVMRLHKTMLSLMDQQAASTVAAAPKFAGLSDDEITSCRSSCGWGDRLCVPSCSLSFLCPGWLRCLHGRSRLCRAASVRQLTLAQFVMVAGLAARRRESSSAMY